MKMKKLILAVMLIAISSQASSAALCQSLRDPSFQAVFEGYTCPSGFYLVRII
jgi:hypothetical protein